MTTVALYAYHFYDRGTADRPAGNAAHIVVAENVDDAYARLYKAVGGSPSRLRRVGDMLPVIRIIGALGALGAPPTKEQP